MLIYAAVLTFILCIRSVSAISCSQCESFVHSTRTLLGFVSSVHDVTVSPAPKLDFDEMLRHHLGGNDYMHTKISEIAKLHPNEISGTIIDVMSYCLKDPSDCGWDYFPEIPLKSVNSMTHTEGSRLMQHENFWTLIEYGCVVESKVHSGTLYVGNGRLLSLFISSSLTLLPLVLDALPRSCVDRWKSVFHDM